MKYLNKTNKNKTRYEIVKSAYKKLKKGLTNCGKLQYNNIRYKKKSKLLTLSK